MRTIRVDLTPHYTTFPPGEVSVGDRLMLVRLGGPKDGEVYGRAVIRWISPNGDITFKITKGSPGGVIKKGEVHTITPEMAG